MIHGKFYKFLPLFLGVGVGAEDLYFTGDLCPAPHGNFTFSDLPLVRREGQTDHVTVSWNQQVENSECAAWFYIKWWSLADSSKPRKTGPIHGRMEERLVLQGNVDREDFVVQVVAVKDVMDDRGSFIIEVFSAKVPVLRSRGPTAKQLDRPSVDQGRRSGILVKWKGLGFTRNLAGYIVRWKTSFETRFRESVLLLRNDNELTISQDKFVEGQDYLFQVVAVLNQPDPIQPRKSSYPQWAKSDLVRHKVKALPLLPTTTTTTTTARSGTIRPTPPRWPTERTTLVGNRVESTSLLPWLGVEPGPNEPVKRLKKFKCGSDAAEKRAFEKKCQKYFNTSKDTSLKSDPLEFVFSWGDSLFVTISASLFSIIGILLNLLVFVSVLNYRVTRRHATTPFILSTTISDLIYSAVILPFMAMRFHSAMQGKGSPFSQTTCHFYPVLYYTVQGASLFSLTVVTLNRAAMLFLPTMVEKIFTNTKVIAGREVPVNSMLLLTVCWLIPLIALIPTLNGRNGCMGLQKRTMSCTIIADSEGNTPKPMLYSVAFTIPFITMVVTDIAIYFKMRSLQKQDVRMSVTKAEERQMERRFLLMLAMILFVFFITYMPGFIVKAIFDKCYMHPTMHVIAYVFNWASVWINPIIYIVAQRKYQDAVRHLYQCVMDRCLGGLRQKPEGQIPSFNLSGSPQAEMREEDEERRKTFKRRQTFLSKYMSRLRTGMDSVDDSGIEMSPRQSMY